MSIRIRESNRNNILKLAHDAVGNYMDFNGLRTYSLTTAITTGVTSSGIAPAGSHARTTHATGIGRLFTSVGGVWVDIKT